SLNEVAAHAATLDLARTLDAAVRAFQQVTTSDSTAVYLFDADRAVLNVAALVFDPRLYPADYDESVRAKPLPIGEGMVGWCALSRWALEATPTTTIALRRRSHTNPLWRSLPPKPMKRSRSSQGRTS